MAEASCAAGTRRCGGRLQHQQHHATAIAVFSREVAMNRWLCLVVVAAPLLAQLPAARQQEIEKMVAQEMSRQSMPGLSIAVGVGGELVWSAGYGFADIENFVPAKALTMYRLASVSKPITAVAVMQLSEAGK